MKYLLPLLLACPLSAYVELGFDTAIQSPYVMYGTATPIHGWSVESSAGLFLCHHSIGALSRTSFLYDLGDVRIGPTCALNILPLSSGPSRAAFMWNTVGGRAAFKLCRGASLCVDAEMLPVTWSYWKPRIGLGVQGAF